MEEEMGALLGSSALLLGALQAQQKLTKKKGPLGPFLYSNQNHLVSQ
jgi:hypothetical protein